jgi:cell cycle checkpoint control protein RAD9A
MAILNFTLSPEALGKVHDALVCLGKFSEAVSLEASQDRVSEILPALKIAAKPFLSSS